MATAPYGVRLLVGAATIAVEETLKLPRTILMYPMTLASQAANLVMHVQQNLAELVIKGDSTLESIFPPRDEQPEWATFDEDLPAGVEHAPSGASNGAGVDGDRRSEGRFALYSVSEAPQAAESPKKDAAAEPEAPTVVAELDYPNLTLAQLRARLQTLDIAELEALLAYEQATTARAPFQTLLANRITRATAK
jgi:hypothetical protein